MDEVNIENIKKATSAAAYIVTEHGEKYWPIFERLERELNEKNSRLERLRSFKRKKPSRLLDRPKQDDIS